MLVRASHSGGSFLVDVHTTHFTDGQHGGLLNSEWRRETVHEHSGHEHRFLLSALPD